MSRPIFRRSPSVLAVLGGATLVACGGNDPFAVRATFETQPVSYAVYPLSNSPQSLPAAISLYNMVAVRPVVRVNQTLNFDVAVDLDANGRVRLLPPVAIVAPSGASLATGMQIINGETFETLKRAPNTGYRYDSATVVQPGQVVAVQTQGAGPLAAVCTTTVPMYAKLVVDSVRTQSNGLPLIFMRARVDQNCGFRSLDVGLPES